MARDKRPLAPARPRAMAAQPTGVMADNAASSLLMLSSLSSTLSAAHGASSLIPSRNMLVEPLPAVTGLIHKKDKPKVCYSRKRACRFMDVRSLFAFAHPFQTYHKVAKDFRCQWCGTSNTPEMRPGPAGKNTLCNRYVMPGGIDFSSTPV